MHKSTWARFGAVLTAWLCGCAASTSSPATQTSSGADAGQADGAAQVVIGAPPAHLQVHHWATFTVFHAAAAQTSVAGVGHAEEQLPAFVHARSLAAAGPPLAQIQTAGAFFHVDAAGDVQVDLAMPQAQVSAEWPPATSGTQGTVASLASGHATWQLHLEPAAGQLPALAGVEPGSLWQSLRAAGGARLTNLAAVGGSDDLLFYRALGNFTPPLQISAKKDASIQGYSGSLSNTGQAEIPRAWLLYLHAGGGLLQPLHNVAGKATTTFSPTPKELPADYFKNVEATLTGALQDAGLTAPEAKALFSSFSHNWLKTFGLRVIVVAPQAWMDNYAQVNVTPRPDSEVRVMLGRFELLTAEDEAVLIAQLAASAQAGDATILQKLGFFAESKARRAQVASKDPVVSALAADLVKAAAAQP